MMTKPIKGYCHVEFVDYHGGTVGDSRHDRLYFNEISLLSRYDLSGPLFSLAL
ncbi:hypothetical protein [Neobacillus niacini]|uniref:hypothetical protein n=1 Tax=Neobacillus niacini TaxID=86668 RepID=UPI003B58697B